MSCHADAHSQSEPDVNFNAYSNGYVCSDSDGNGDSYVYAYTNSNSYSHTIAYSDAYGDQD